MFLLPTIVYLSLFDCAVLSAVDVPGEDEFKICSGACCVELDMFWVGAIWPTEGPDNVGLLWP